MTSGVEFRICSHGLHANFDVNSINEGGLKQPAFEVQRKFRSRAAVTSAVVAGAEGAEYCYLDSGAALGFWVLSIPESLFPV